MRRVSMALACCGAVTLVAAGAAAQDGEAAGEPAPPSVEQPLPGEPAPPNADAGAGAYDARLHALEEDVAGLKEKIYRSKSRLMLLREQILHDVIAEARAAVVHVNEMSDVFTLEEIVYYLDGNRIYFQDNRGGVLDEQREFEVFSGTVVPGNHTLSVEMVYRGDGGLFSYVDGYRFRIKSNNTFYAKKGRITRVRAIGHERGGATADLRDRPYVRYEVEAIPLDRAALEKMTGSGGD